MTSSVRYYIESFSVHTMQEEDFRAYKFMPNRSDKDFSFRETFLDLTGYNPGSKEGNKQVCKQCGKSGPECLGHPVVLDLK